MRAKAIERHPNGRRYLRYQENGKKHRVLLGTSEKEAQRNLKKYRNSHELGRLLSNGQPTSQTLLPSGQLDLNLKELIVRHLEFVKKNRSDSTFILRQWYLLCLLEFLGARPISSIIADDLHGYADWIKENHSHSKKGGWHAIREARTLMHWGNDSELINFPMSRFPKGSAKRAVIKRFTSEEMAKLLSVAKGEFGDMIRFNAIMGLRPKELRELRHDQIDWDAQPRPMLVIEEHKTFQASRVPIPRSVPLTEVAIEILHHQRLRHPKSKIVFLNGNGGPYQPTAFRNRLIRLCRKAGIEEKSPYSLRHYAGTQLAQRTGISTVAQILGHSNIATTMRYIKNNEPSHLKAMDDMGALLESLGKRPKGKTVKFRKVE